MFDYHYDFIFLAKTVKGVRFHPISKLTVSQLLFPRHWQKTGDSRVRDKQLYYLQQ